MIVLLACAAEPPETSKDSGYLSNSTVIEDGCGPGVAGTYFRYVDQDDDGYGDSDLPFEACVPTLGAAVSGDCDDQDPAVHPQAAEPCAGPDLDCDGLVGTAAASDAVPWYDDEDGDGWGGAAHEASCEVPEGAVFAGGDCDDAAAGVHPGAFETCDGVDQDCDGKEDDGAVGDDVWFRDADGDGWGDEGVVSYACVMPGGFTATPGDCDDLRPAVHPEATEPDCINGDGNCDGIPDDLTVDADRDGTRVCDDCDDSDPEIHPGVEDACLDGVDQDCDLVDGTCFPDEGGVTEAGSLEIAWGPAVGDVDGDGQVDLVLIRWDGAAGDLAAWFGPFAASPAIDAPDARSPTDGFLADAALVSASGALFLTDPTSDLAADRAGALYLLEDPLVDTVEAPTAIITGDAEGDYLGEEIGLGDPDGDGVEDALLSDPGEGLVAVVPGGTRGLWTRSELDTAVVGDPDEAFGDRVTALDWDGDGVDDLVVSAGYSAAFALYPGPLAGIVASDAAAFVVSTSAELPISGLLSSGPDLDGDGREDLLVGVRDTTGNDRVRLHPGGSTPLTLDDATWDLADPLLGSAVDTLLVTGESRLVIADAAAGESRGAAWVFAGPLVGSATTADAVAARIGSVDEGALGFAGAAGDIDGDGRDDAVLGERGAVWFWLGAGW